MPPVERLAVWRARLALGKVWTWCPACGNPRIVTRRLGHRPSWCQSCGARTDQALEKGGQ